MTRNLLQQSLRVVSDGRAKVKLAVNTIPIVEVDQISFVPVCVYSVKRRKCLLPSCVEYGERKRNRIVFSQIPRSNFATKCLNFYAKEVTIFSRQQGDFL